MTTTTGRSANISVNSIIRGSLPATAAGVRWLDTNWTECRAHLEDQSWAAAVDASDEPTGIILDGRVDCDACAEAIRDHEALLHGASSAVSHATAAQAAAREGRDKAIRDARDAGWDIAAIARVAGMSRQAVYGALAR